MKREFTRLPSPEVASCFGDLAKLLEEHQRTLSAFRKGKADYEALQLERQRARGEDGKARVEAYRAGEPDPGSKHEAKVLKKMESLEDRTAVLEAAYVAVEQDIGALVSAHRAEWLPKVRDLIREDGTELTALLGQVRDVLDRRQAHAGLAEWVAELPSAYSKKVFVEGSITEDMAYGVLLGSAQAPEAIPDSEAGAA